MFFGGEYSEHKTEIMYYYCNIVNIQIIEFVKGVSNYDAND